jgi:hypothetical protein
VPNKKKIQKDVSYGGSLTRALHNTSKHVKEEASKRARKKYMIRLPNKFEDNMGKKKIKKFKKKNLEREK